MPLSVTPHARISQLPECGRIRAGRPVHAVANPDLRIRTYLRSFFNDWLTGMCGPISVPFAAGALWVKSQYLKVLWGFLAASCFLFASYRVWRKERSDGHDNVETFGQENAELQGQIAALKRKPYTEELKRQAAETIARMSPEGRILLRHLLTIERIELGRQFKPDIPQNVQDAQIEIAFRARIVRHLEVRAGTGMLIRTDYEVNPQFRPVLEDLLFNE